SSNQAIDGKNKELYQAFNENEAMEGQRDRVKPFNDKAKQIKAAAEDLNKYLENWKERIIEESGGREDDGEIKRLDNIDAATLLLVERKGGDSLKARLKTYNDLLLSLIDPKMKAAMGDQLPI